ncbi:hypothetical protein GCK72_008576 [Caenorhabditis remanei]|uniref:Domain of unknown function WSN domain-containing protein n=1 Tax=Caenorhabditis remanei TaxID=31234 RepID=A0A6A5GZ21_CAERE|nr:hypothetical protein GCK72_008576 [Caenorhabditis remanei]KAF1760327.1 hypothetical protein GCK72_008576 [Caenorhabditis remanei]
MRNELLILLIMNVATASSEPRPHALSTAVINRYKEFKRSTASAHHHTLINVSNSPSNAENVTSRIKISSLDAYSFVPADSLQSLSDSGNILSRSKRSPNDAAFTTLQSHVSALARVVTGISLYNGLVDNSISSDQAITELMNLGSISLKELETFDKKKVDDFVKKLKEASSKMATESAGIERNLVDFHAMKNMWNDAGDLTKIPNRAKFETLNSLTSLDLGVLEDFKEGNDASSSLESLKKASKTAVEEMNKANVLNILKEMSPFHKFTQMIEYYDNAKVYVLSTTADSIIATLKQDLQELQSIVGAAGSVISALSGIVSSRSGSNDINRQHTIGFVNGYLDLKNIMKDSVDAWLQNSLKQFNGTEGLSVFNGLAEKMSSLDEKWKAANEESTRTSLKHAEKLETHSRTLNYHKDSIDPLIKRFQGCPFVFVDATYTANAAQLSKNMKKLEKKVETIHSISRLTQANSDDAQKVLGHLKIHLKILKGDEKVGKIAGELLGKSDFYEKILTNKLGQAYLTFFNHLKDIKEDSSGLSAAAQLAIDFRDLQTIASFETDIATASSAIPGSTNLIATIKSKIDKVRSSETGKKLIKLKELAKYSKPLGDSSESLSRVQKALERKKELLDFVENGNVVEEAT